MFFLMQQQECVGGYMDSKIILNDFELNESYINFIWEIWCIEIGIELDTTQDVDYRMSKQNDECLKMNWIIYSLFFQNLSNKHL